MFLLSHLCTRVDGTMREAIGWSTIEGGIRTLVVARGEIWVDHTMAMMFTFFGEVAGG